MRPLIQAARWEPLAAARAAPLALQLASLASLLYSLDSPLVSPTSTHPNIYPILLAAGPSPGIDLAHPLPRLGGRTPLELAVANCAGLPNPIVVLGYCSSILRKKLPPEAHPVLNRNWRAGQLSSLLVGLKRVPRSSAFLLYPVDHIFLTRHVVCRLVRAFLSRTTTQSIVMPRWRGHAGHPVIFAPELIPEIRSASTAREVVYHDTSRILYISIPIRFP
jgi:CTP:molybdopterin cytidylyltransferase MocA